jgi:hypothetical protein
MAYVADGGYKIRYIDGISRIYVFKFGVSIFTVYVNIDFCRDKISKRNQTVAISLFYFAYKINVGVKRGINTLTNERPQAPLQVPTEPSPKILTPPERNLMFPANLSKPLRLTWRSFWVTFKGFDCPWEFFSLIAPSPAELRLHSPIGVTHTVISGRVQLSIQRSQTNSHAATSVALTHNTFVHWDRQTQIIFS